MKFIIGLLILIGVFWAFQQVFQSYRSVEQKQAAAERGEPPPSAPAPGSNLPGLPPSMETSLAAAQSKGASGLRDWLNTYRSYVKDPRLAAIELDYVLLISHQDPAEARRIFQEVKSRTPQSSPVYERVKRLEAAFQ